MTNKPNMEPEQGVACAGSAGLTATLFTTAGKRTAVIDLLDRASATVTAADDWLEGSIAILIRHGVRIFGTLRRDDDGRARVAFDDPLEGWRRDRFIDHRRTGRPIVIRERLAA